MSNNRLGCYYCFKTLNPQDDDERLSSFVRCSQCNIIYHTFCWNQIRTCLSCGGSQFEQIEVAQPPPLSVNPKTRSLPIKVSKIAYSTDTTDKNHLKPIFISVGVIGVIIIIAVLQRGQPNDRSNSGEAPIIPKATPSHVLTPTPAKIMDTSATPSPIVTPRPIAIQERRYSRREKRFIHHCPGVNLRANPTGESSLITDLSCGTQVDVLGEAPSLKDPAYKWYHVQIGRNMEGWIYAGENDTWIQRSSLLGIVETKETRLNIRRGAGREYKVIGKAQKGGKLTILSKEGEWYHVQLQRGTKGYVHGDFIRILE